MEQAFRLRGYSGTRTERGSKFLVLSEWSKLPSGDPPWRTGKAKGYPPPGCFEQRVRNQLILKELLKTWWQKSA